MPIGISMELGGPFLYELGGNTSGIIRRVAIGKVQKIILSGITDRCRCKTPGGGAGGIS